MIKKVLLLSFVFVCFNVFSAEKEIEQRILVFDFITNEELFLDKNLTDIFIEALKNNYDYEITSDSKKMSIKEIIDTGESQNCDKVVTGKLSFFDKNYYLELTCFSVDTRDIFLKETILENNINDLIIKLEETTKSFFVEKKLDKKELRKYKKIKFLSEKSGKVGKRMLAGGIVTSIISPIIFSLLIWSHIAIGMSMGAIGVVINLFLSIATISFGVLIIAGIILIAIGSNLIYKHKKSTAFMTDFKDHNMRIAFVVKI